MADKRRNSNSSSRISSSADEQPSRLQRRRPASLQISPASSSFWSAAIPLLSPLDTSPTAVDRKSSESSVHQQQNQNQSQQRGGGGGEAGEKGIVFKKWQHPAAPFCYEPGKLKPSFFVPV